MKATAWGLILISASIIFGCKKSEIPAGAEVQTIDATQFRPAFASAAAETQRLVDGVMISIQSSNFTNALAGLDTLASRTDLTENQKKVVTDLNVQVRKKIAAAESKPPQ